MKSQLFSYCYKAIYSSDLIPWQPSKRRRNPFPSSSLLIQNHYHSVHLQIYFSLAKIWTRFFFVLFLSWESPLWLVDLFRAVNSKLYQLISYTCTHTLGTWFPMFQIEDMAMTAFRAYIGPDTLILWSHVVAAFQSIHQWFSVQLKSLNLWPASLFLSNLKKY